MLAGYTSVTGGVAAFNGNVGIGTNAPGSYKLNVSGNTNLGGTITSSSLVSCDRVNTDSGGMLDCSQSVDLHVSKIEVSGHSYTTGFGASSQYVYGYTNVLASLLHAQSQNHGVGGAVASWNQTGANPGDGGYAKVLQDVKPTRTAAPYLPMSGVGIINYGINDLGADTSCSSGPFIQAERAIISRYRAAAVFEESDSSVAFAAGGGPAWGTVASTNDNSGSGYKSAGGNGNTYTITVPSDFPGGTIDIGLIATQGSNGAVHTFTVDGSAAGSIDTRGIAATNSGKKTGVVKRFTGLSAGAHTIVGTISSFTGSTYFDYWQIEAPQSRVVLVENLARMFTYTIYSTWTCTPTDSNVAAANTALTSLVAEFDSSVIMVDADSALAKTQANFAGDNAHPNDQGYAKIAAVNYKALTAASATLDQLAYSTQPSATYTNNTLFQNNNDSTTAFQIQNSSGGSLFNVDTTNSRIGIGTSTPGYQLDVQNNTSSQLHLNNNGTDTGLWLFGGFNGAFLSDNAYFNGTSWIAKGTTAGMLSMQNNGLTYNSNSGLTAGNAFTPTARLSIGATGNVGIGTTTLGTSTRLNINDASTLNNLATVEINTNAATNKGLVVQGFASQSADLLQAQDSSGTILASITSAGNLTVKAATITGVLTVNGHVVTGNTSGSTTAAVNANAGTGGSPACSVSGNDTGGQITLTTGTSAWAAGIQCTVTFSSSFGSAPHPVITPASNVDSSAVKPYVTSGTGSFTISFIVADTAQHTFTFNYFNAQ